MKFIKLIIQPSNIRYLALACIGEITIGNDSEKYYIKFFDKTCENSIYGVEVSEETLNQLFIWLDECNNNVFNLKVIKLIS